MNKEERIKAAEAYAEGKSSSEVFRRAHIDDFLAGSEAEAESNKSVSVQDAKTFMWDWLNEKQLLDVSLDNDDIQLLMADFANNISIKEDIP